mmetsp:Transcript_100145/g.306141  ORF Transcript_100145/g.306141 Transcript_100145/m.306141 type:complete len:250 (+) Transcript_100145:348-1097(+)
MSVSANNSRISSELWKPSPSHTALSSRKESVPFPSVSAAANASCSCVKRASSNCRAKTPAQMWPSWPLCLCPLKRLIAPVSATAPLALIPGLPIFASHGWLCTPRALIRLLESTSSKHFTRSLASLDTSDHSAASKENLPFTMVLLTSAPKKGELPDSSTNSTHPRAHKSMPSSHASPLSASGAVYRNVPTLAFSLTPRKILQPKPKSITLTVNSSTSSSSSSTIKIFSGLMSRCTTPCAWQYASASAT